MNNPYPNYRVTVLLRLYCVKGWEIAKVDVNSWIVRGAVTFSKPKSVLSLVVGISLWHKSVKKCLPSVFVHLFKSAAFLNKSLCVCPCETDRPSFRFRHVRIVPSMSNYVVFYLVFELMISRSMLDFVVTIYHGTKLYSSLAKIFKLIIINCHPWLRIKHIYYFFSIKYS